MHMAAGATKQDALRVIRTLRRAGFEALLAGGCVRDMLLGQRPTDYDVATNATPQQVRKLFRRVLMVGAKFGVAMVLCRDRQVEVATFRDDLSYTDGRRPDGVRFSTARADALRRDFTINGMFYDPVTTEVIDHVGGQTDLGAGIIRAIGNPAQRLAEDYLRLLRAVRFAARLDFTLEAATAKAIRREGANLAKISGERIRDELEKMLAGPHAAAAMAMVHDLGLTEPIFGAKVADESTWSPVADRLAAVEQFRDPALSLACILADTDTRTVRALCRLWGASNEWRNTLVDLVLNLPRWRTAADMPLPAFKRLMARPTWDRLRRLWRIEETRLTGRDRESRRIARRAGAIDPAQIAPAAWVRGEDLKRLGLTEGPRLGRVLATLYDLQLAEQLPTRAAALRQAKVLVAKS